MAEHEAIRPSDEEIRERFSARDRDEMLASARAVAIHREEADALKQLDDLSEFERTLAGFAFNAGRNFVRSRVKELVGPATETVRADVLWQHIDAATPMVHDFGPRNEMGDARWVSPGNVAAARLVAHAADTVKARAEAEIRTRGDQ